MEGKNTFLSLQINIDNSSYTSWLDKSKNTILSIATAIGAQNSIRTGWSIDGSCYDNSTGLPKLINSKAEEASDFWTINLNHISGSVLRLGVTDEFSPNSIIAFIPPLSPIELKGDTRDLPINISLRYTMLANPMADTITLFMVIDTTGNGFWSYQKSDSDIWMFLLGDYVKQFCYPQQINSALNGLCRYVFHSDDFIMTMAAKYYDSEWINCVIDQGKIISAMANNIPSTKAILSPILLKTQSDNMPYGYISSKVMSFINGQVNTSTDQGKILDNGNFLIAAFSDSSEHIDPSPFALGWSSENIADNNPFAPTT